MPRREGEGNRKEDQRWGRMNEKWGPGLSSFCHGLAGQSCPPSLPLPPWSTYCMPDCGALGYPTSEFTARPPGKRAVLFYR